MLSRLSTNCPIAIHQVQSAGDCGTRACADGRRQVSISPDDQATPQPRGGSSPQLQAEGEGAKRISSHQYGQDHGRQRIRVRVLELSSIQYVVDVSLR